MASWLQFLLSVLCAVVGGFIGGWTVAYRLGAWRQSVEDRLAVAEARLQRGDPHVGKVPIHEVKIDAIKETVDEIKEALRAELPEIRRELRVVAEGSVSHEECDRRHGKD